MTIKFDLEKFDGKNDFNLWRLRMKALLVQQGLSKALLGSEALPTEMKKEDKAELMEKAHSALLLCLGNDVLREVASEQTAAGLWKKLEERYMTKSLTNRWYLKKRLYMLRMREGTSISDHLNNYNKILMDLENIGAMIEEEDRSILLVCLLPSSYENFVETLMYGKESVSVEEIKSVLSSRKLKRWEMMEFPKVLEMVWWSEEEQTTKAVTTRADVLNSERQLMPSLSQGGTLDEGLSGKKGEGKTNQSNCCCRRSF